MEEPTLEAVEAARQWLHTGIATVEAQGSMERHLARALDAFAAQRVHEERERILEAAEGIANVNGLLLSLSDILGILKDGINNKT